MYLRRLQKIEDFSSWETKNDCFHAIDQLNGGNF